MNMTQNGTNPIIQDKMTGVMEMAALVSSSKTWSEIMDQAVKSVCYLTQAEAGSLLLVDDHTGHLQFEVVMGEQSNVLPYFRVPKGQGIAGWVFENDTPIIVPDVQKDERFYRYVDQELKFTTREMIAVPLRADDAVIGVLQVINKREGLFNNDDLDLAMAFATQIAAVVHEINKEKPATIS
jgi:GAF domain-containing protein